MRRTGFQKPSPQKVKELNEKKRQKAFSKIKEAKRPKPRKATKKRSTAKKTGNKRKSKTLAQLKKQLDTVFSIYIRTTHSVDGICTCYTCGKQGTIKELQNGHFVSRGYTATRWHEDNCRPQCVGCNIFGNGKPLDFEEHLKNDFTDEYVEEIKAMRHQIVKPDRQWYLEQIEKYTI